MSPRPQYLHREPRRTFWLAVSVSLVFGIAVQAAEDKPSTRRWYKGNTHTHSLWSDGNDFPDMIVDWYHQRGYHFLVLSDHNVLSEGEKWMPVTDIVRRAGNTDVIEKYDKRFGKDWVQRKTMPHARTKRPTEHIRLRTLDEVRARYDKPGKFLMVQGEEITGGFNRLPVHINAMNIQERIWPSRGKSVRETMRLTLQQVLEQEKKTGKPILTHLNHPNFGWALTAEDLANVLEERFFEVYNGHPGVRHLGDKYHASVERLWDIANTIRLAKLNAPPLLGIASDDAHHYHGRKTSRMGRGWVMVHAKALTPQALIEAMRGGHFYGSSGVTLKSIRFTPAASQPAKAAPAKLSIEIEPKPGVQYTTQIIGTPVDADIRGEPMLGPDGKPVRATLKYSDQVGKVFATIKGTTVHYTLTGKERYIRATITSDKPHRDPSFKGQTEQAWTQPVGWRQHLAKPAAE